jgi:predicted DNA-binding transcriptional regulator AlpA
LNVSENDPLIGIADVAEMLDLTPRTIRTLISKGNFAEPYRVGGVMRWRKSEFLAWLASTKQMRPAPQGAAS